MKILPPSILHIPYAIKIPYVILADKAFSLNEYTMKPFQGKSARGSFLTKESLIAGCPEHEES